MPTIQKGDLVLVTGASGFIAAHAVDAFLREGFAVRGTVRSEDKGEFLKNVFKGKGQFEYVIIKDMAKDGAFDEAVKGVDAVAHMASPFHFKADEPDELIIPAVHGTTGVLNSLKKNNPNVKRVVITSSVAAVINSNIQPPHTFTEADWNTVSIGECETKGRDASGVDKYRASKTKAEQAFWQWFKDEKSSLEGVVINPPLVIGPIIHPVADVDSLNTSVANFYDYQKGAKADVDVAISGGPTGNFIDVRDCALAHVRALTVPEAAGQRFICSNGPYSPNDFAVALNRLYPDATNIPKGDPNARDRINAGSNVFDGSKCAKVLGIKYTPIETVLEDMAKDLKAKFGP